MIESVSKRKEELNVVIVRDNQKHNEDDIVKFPTIEIDENRKIKIVTTEENQEFQTVFEDDPVIVIPEKSEVEKSVETEEERFEEKICHEENYNSGAEDEQMLGGDFALKVVLKNLQEKIKVSKFQESRKVIEEFFRSNVDSRLSIRKNIIDVEERRVEIRITKAGEKEL
jgi:hypothetical protein